MVTQPEDVSSRTVILEWEPEDNALWYQAWVGPADYSTTNYIDWSDGRTVCDNGICRVVVPNPVSPGEYEFWLQAWNPVGTTNWQKMTEFTVN